MDQSFDIGALVLVALIALLVGYLIGRLVGANNSAPPLPARPLARMEERDEIRALVARGDRVGAVRRLRELTGAGLADAAHAVQVLEGEDPAMRLGLIPPGGRANDR